MATYIEKFSEKAQATIEYLLLFTAVLIVLIIFLGGPKSFFGRSFQGSLDRSTNGVSYRVNQIIQSR